jgi:hypothetical protein
MNKISIVGANIAECNAGIASTISMISDLRWPMSMPLERIFMVLVN